MNTKHTSTPWHVDKSKSFYVFSEGSLAEQAGVTNGPFICNASTEANAAFIVRACNAHDDLVTALEIIATMGLPASNQQAHVTDQVGHVNFITGIARAALAKAKGE